MSRTYKQLWDLDSSRIVVESLEIATSLWKRSIGLLGRRHMTPGSGLWIAPCNGVHTLGMLFPIDVVFIDSAGVVIRVVDGLQPWRMCGPFRAASIVLEMPAGAATSAGIKPGARVMLTQSGPPVFATNAERDPV